MSLLKFIKPGM